MSQSQREEGHNTICPHKRGEGNFKMKYIPLIIVLLLILAILVLVFYGVSRVKRFSRQLFVTGSEKSTGGCRVNTAFGFCDDKDCPASDRFRFPGFSIR